MKIVALELEHVQERLGRGGGRKEGCSSREWRTYPEIERAKKEQWTAGKKKKAEKRRPFHSFYPLLLCLARARAYDFMD